MNLQLRNGAGDVIEVYDPLRRRWLVLTPEERVRQAFVCRLLSECHVPVSRIANEVAINLNGVTRRCDTVIYADDLSPVAIVEYKAPGVRVSRKAFEQIVSYNMVFHVGHLILSDGLSDYAFRVDYEAHRCIPLDHLPTYAELTAR